MQKSGQLGSWRLAGGVEIASAETEKANRNKKTETETETFAFRSYPNVNRTAKELWRGSCSCSFKCFLASGM